MLLDHAELCSQETRRNTEANGPCQALLGMRGICKKPPHGTTGLVDRACQTINLATSCRNEKFSEVFYSLSG